MRNTPGQPIPKETVGRMVALLGAIQDISERVIADITAMKVLSAKEKSVLAGAAKALDALARKKQEARHDATDLDLERRSAEELENLQEIVSKYLSKDQLFDADERLRMHYESQLTTLDQELVQLDQEIAGHLDKLRELCGDYDEERFMSYLDDLDALTDIDDPEVQRWAEEKGWNQEEQNLIKAAKKSGMTVTPKNVDEALSVAKATHGNCCDRKTVLDQRHVIRNKNAEAQEEQEEVHNEIEEAQEGIEQIQNQNENLDSTDTADLYAEADEQGVDLAEDASIQAEGDAPEDAQGHESTPGGVSPNELQSGPEEAPAPVEDASEEQGYESDSEVVAEAEASAEKEDLSNAQAVDEAPARGAPLAEPEEVVFSDDREEDTKTGDDTDDDEWGDDDDDDEEEEIMERPSAPPPSGGRLQTVNQSVAEPSENTSPNPSKRDL